jgi:hypothetical protein
MDVEVAGSEQPAGVLKCGRVREEAEDAADSSKFGRSVWPEKRCELCYWVNQSLAGRAYADRLGFRRLQERMKFGRCMGCEAPCIL